MTIHRVSAADTAWVAGILQRVTVLARSYGDPPTSTHASLAALDAIWSAGLTSLAGTKGEPADLINLVGIGIGQYLVDTLGLEWCAVSDEYGDDIGVHGGPTAAVICPTALVAKRWDTQDAPFVVATVTELVGDIMLTR